ncbi:hypothetical protein BU16DRAFT_378608 [Lophium mytilinum]|uniref:Uncharacterized protein n=1 Tax=Lophium mytilinum TaxID=390894 RepID=A0A6A6QS98_9PEZI|nr:hypothetical protein BU16DRAFT_378608 [Lophium mytilinum]
MESQTGLMSASLASRPSISSASSVSSVESYEFPDSRESLHEHPRASTSDSLSYAQTCDGDSFEESNRLVPPHAYPEEQDISAAEKSTFIPTTITTNPKAKKNLSVWQQTKHRWHHGFVAEICCCIIAIFALVLTGLTLRMNHNRPLHRWPLHISINALISVLTGLLKVGVSLPITEGISQLKWQWFGERPQDLIDIENFDLASRDAWGSLRFIFRMDTTGLVYSWHPPWRVLLFPFQWQRQNIRKYFTKFAALLAVLTFMIDPFTQQMVGFVDCYRTVGSDRNSTGPRGAISRTNTYAVSGDQLPTGKIEIDGPMAVAITTGLVNPPTNASSLVQAECPSGNCTFDLFQTIGICHSCQDVSQMIQEATDNYTLSDIFPDGRSIGVKREVPLQTSVSRSDNATILEVAVLLLPPVPGDQPFAVNCRIDPCVKTYNSSMTNTVLNETLVSSTPIGANALLNTFDPSFMSYLLATRQTLRNGQWGNCTPVPAMPMHTSDGYDAINSDFVLVSNANIDAAPNETLAIDNGTLWPKDCVWQFGLYSDRAIREELTTDFDNLTIHYRNGGDIGPLYAKKLWMYGNASFTSVDQAMRDLTDTMTATVRSEDLTPTEWAVGNVSVRYTCIQVRWAWFSFPAVLVGLATIFLIVLILQSPGGMAERTWKSSSLAILFCALDDAMKIAGRFELTREEMLRLAKTTTAQLVQDEEGRARFL